MITNQMINKSIDYILSHLNEEITIVDVANYCHLRQRQERVSMPSDRELKKCYSPKS